MKFRTKSARDIMRFRPVDRDYLFFCHFASPLVSAPFPVVKAFEVSQNSQNAIFTSPKSKRDALKCHQNAHALLMQRKKTSFLVLALKGGYKKFWKLKEMGSNFFQIFIETLHSMMDDGVCQKCCTFFQLPKFLVSSFPCQH